MKRLTLVAVLIASSVFAADPPKTTTLYKSVGPDGTTVYSDSPPASGSPAQVLNYKNLPASPLSAATLAYIEHLRKFKPTVPVAATPEVVLFTTTWCGYCRKARAYLTSRGLAYRDVDIETHDGVVAYVQAGGGNGVPLLVANGRHVQGFTTAVYDAFFESTK
jgi:glutaredoxin